MVEAHIQILVKTVRADGKITGVICFVQFAMLIFASASSALGCPREQAHLRDCFCATPFLCRDLCRDTLDLLQEQNATRKVYRRVPERI